MAKRKAVETMKVTEAEPESTSIFIYKGVVFSNAEFVKRVIDENPYIKENWELLLSAANALYNNPFTITDKSADLFDLVKNLNLPKSLEGKKEFLENFSVFWNLSVWAYGTFPNSVFAGLDKPIQKAIKRNGKALEKLRESKYSEMPLKESTNKKSENTGKRKIERSELKNIVKKYIIDHCDEMKAWKGRTLLPIIKKSIMKNLLIEYPDFDFNAESVFSNFRKEGFAERMKNDYEN